MKKFIFTKSIKHKGIKFKKFSYGTWALQTIRYGVLSTKHVSFIKQYLQKSIKKFKNFKFNITLNKVSTKKPLDTRMGGGKGSVSEMQYVLKPGSIFLEMYNIPPHVMFSIFKTITNKISIKVKLLSIN